MSDRDQPSLIDADFDGDELLGGLTGEEQSEYRRRLAEMLKDPEFRKIDGFPNGSDEAILALSAPPFYTACPNPFLAEWLADNTKVYDPETDDYHREPFAADVSEGKNHPIYNAHSYHTKVPHRAIMRYILHYTEPGDVVYDGFCGTGMTGVAAQLCGNIEEVRALGYTVDLEGQIWDSMSWTSHEAADVGAPNPLPFVTDPKPLGHLGTRQAILKDLSPAATFIAHNYNAPIEARVFERKAKRVLAEFDSDCGWMYSCLHREKGKWIDTEWLALVSQCADGISRCSTADEARDYISSLRKRIPIGAVEYTVWSDVLLCPQCGGEIVFFDAAFDSASGGVADTFACPSCRAEGTKRSCSRKTVTVFDPVLKQSIQVPAQESVLVSYRMAQGRSVRQADEFDQALAKLSDTLPIPSHYPTNELPIKEMGHGSRLAPKGVTHLHHFHTSRARRALAWLWSRVGEEPQDRMRSFLYFTVDQTVWGMSKLNRYVPTHFSQVNRYLNGVYYLGALQTEVAPRYILDGKITRLASAFTNYSPVECLGVISTGSCASPLPLERSVDYIFTDPPFGENIPYADLNILVESWHGVTTRVANEAIVDGAKGKSLLDYQQLMTACFSAYFDALKPARWMTVEFSNSSNAVWNAIQEALERVGFVVADIRILDKQSGSFRQVTAASAVKQDLVISCYKPSDRFVREFDKNKGSLAGVVEFIEQHLEMLPVAPLTKDGRLENLSERSASVLFERMVAYHLIQGARIPLSMVGFEAVLNDNFYAEDCMWFLPNQLAKYQARKMRGAETEQLGLFMQDERSAVRWIRARLEEEPMKEGELNPLFMKELKEWPPTEPTPELRELLRENFIIAADGMWQTPDPANEQHLEALRRNQRLKQFRQYLMESKTLRTFRKEAVLEGFRYCWQTKQYGVIVNLCSKMRPVDLQADRELMQFFDIAKDLTPHDESGQMEFVYE